ALGDTEPEVRMGVVKALGYSESYRAIIPVSEMLKDPDNGVRREAALALGWLKDKRGIEPLIDILKDINEDPSVRSGALLSLFRLESGVTTAPVIEQIRSGEERNRIRAMEVLQASLRDEESVLLNRKGLIQPLMELLQDQDKEIRRAAIKTLCLIKDTAITPVIIGTLSDKSDDVRKEAAAGLGELRDRRATNPLTGLLKDKDDAIRSAAIKSLGFLLDKSAVPSIYQIVNDKNEKKTIRLSALSALQEIDFYYWNRNAYLFLEDSIPEIRHEAVKSVGKVHSTQSVDLLIKCLQNDKDRGVRREVIAALGSYKENRVVDLLIGIIKSSSEAKDIRAEAINSLTQIGDDRAVIHLYGIAQNKRDELRAEAADAIEHFGK
ncbi:MAG: HEAT repeat domain-containing protein, partial [Nitrospira sp.]|nr:HEAT repeat domain-containing protein [Nitrospira sp.]